VIDIPDEVSFATEIQPIFNSKCATCHTATAPVLTAGNSYNALINGNYINTTDPAASEIVVKTNTGHGGLTPGEKALLLAWITDGAQNN
jgi:mono/diheme cytochrome c family protein